MTLILGEFWKDRLKGVEGCAQKDGGVTRKEMTL